MDRKRPHFKRLEREKVFQKRSGSRDNRVLAPWIQTSADIVAFGTLFQVYRVRSGVKHVTPSGVVVWACDPLDRSEVML
jgi:hypothetical protein